MVGLLDLCLRDGAGHACRVVEEAPYQLGVLHGPFFVVFLLILAPLSQAPACALLSDLHAEVGPPPKLRFDEDLVVHQEE